MKSGDHVRIEVTDDFPEGFKERVNEAKSVSGVLVSREGEGNDAVLTVLLDEGVVILGFSQALQSGKHYIRLHERHVKWVSNGGATLVSPTPP